MFNLIDQMSFIVPVLSISFIIITILINLYMKIRKIFPIRVNCWFCNSYERVPYNQINSWNCGHCEQYNGFDKDGNYNCDIPAQRSIQLNQKWKTGETDKLLSYFTTTPQRNRLCENCNRNQEIKVQQLALFEPVIKENFDMEIESFREKLEKSYELCYNCQTFVKKTLNRIMNNVLGLRLAQIEGKGLQLLDRLVEKADSKNRIIFNRICLLTISLLSVWNLCNSSKSVHLSKSHFDSYFPPLATHLILIIISFISAVRLLVIEYSLAIFSTIGFNLVLSYMTENNSGFFELPIVHDYQVDFVINLAAVLLSIKLVLARCSSRLGSLLLMFLWNVNMLWPTIAGSMLNEFAEDLLKIFFGMIILVVVSLLNYTLFDEARYECQPKNHSFHRIYSNGDEDLSENSDGEATFNGFDFYGSTHSERKYGSPNQNHILSTSFDPNETRSQGLDSHLSWHQQYNRDWLERKMSPSSIPDDCQNKLTDLNISGHSRSHGYTITCASPTTSILAHDRGRSQLLTPARLNFKEKTPLSSSATKTSWVAGGFFVKNNLSPHKLQQTESIPLHPISRTSSQSSGFESRASSTRYTSGSRESSIAGDFSEPTFISDRPLSINFSSNHSYSLTKKNQKTFANNSTSSCEPGTKFYMTPSTNYANNEKLKTSTSFYHQFGTHRFKLNDNDNKFPHHFCKYNTVKQDNLLLSDELN